MVKSSHFEIDMNCQEKRMLYYVFSDSHGFSGNMLAVLQQKLPDELVFLGDGELDLLDIKKKYPDLVIHNVRGNCDVASTARLQMVIKCGRKKIFLCHGHTMNVKDSLDTLVDNAFAAEASVALFGHTHLPYTGFAMAMDIMNPGTIGECPDPTYGVLTIDGFRVDTKIVHVNSLQK